MTLGIAFGGGGARGSAHIGVLQELDVLAIKPDLVTGTSIGGLVAALVAFGFSTVELEKFFNDLVLAQLYRLPTGLPAASSNRKFEALLEQYLGRPTFADLQIPAALISTDLVSQQEVVMTEGDVVSAILATTALPMMLPPIEREGLILVDGGLLNNVPFDVARALGADVVVAIDIMNGAPYGSIVAETPHDGDLVTRALAAGQRNKMWQLVSTMADIIASTNVKARLQQQPPDLLIEPYMGTISMLDFHRLADGIAAGRQAARELTAPLQQLVAVATSDSA